MKLLNWNQTIEIVKMRQLESGIDLKMKQMANEINLKTEQIESEINLKIEKKWNNSKKPEKNYPKFISIFLTF